MGIIGETAEFARTVYYNARVIGHDALVKAGIIQPDILGLMHEQGKAANAQLSDEQVGVLAAELALRMGTQTPNAEQ